MQLLLFFTYSWRSYVLFTRFVAMPFLMLAWCSMAIKKSGTYVIEMITVLL